VTVSEVDRQVSLKQATVTVTDILNRLEHKGFGIFFEVTWMFPKVVLGNYPILDSISPANHILWNSFNTELKKP